MTTTIISLILVAAPFWGQQQVSVAEVLSRVSANVKEFRESLPDFVCSEKITSTYSSNNQISRKKIIESMFEGRQEKSGRLAFTESREILSIDGKAVPKRTPLPELPAFFGGGFSSVLQMTFGQAEVQYQSYRIPYGIPDSENGTRSNRFIVEFETKRDQTGLRILL